MFSWYDPLIGTATLGTDDGKTKGRPQFTDSRPSAASALAISVALSMRDEGGRRTV